jgi:copper resistance protein C
VKRAALGSFLAMMVLLLVGLAPAVSAHTELILSTPEDGAVLDAVPSEVTLTFSEPLIPDAVTISVQDTTGLVITVADPVIDGSDVTIAWPPGLQGSAFDVNYRVVSQDGHPVSGKISFTTPATDVPSTPASPLVSTSPLPPADIPSPPAEPGNDGGPPIAAIVIGLAIGVAIGGLLLLRGRRSPTP